LILGQAARLVVAGAAAGLGVAVVARPFVPRLVQGVSIDPALMGATTALLCVVVALAGWRPARRAARVEPTLALKGE
jgi:putative ABC transport system permease protein